jgi:ABC-type spermidine/putrescine transport system permease subunit I
MLFIMSFTLKDSFFFTPIFTAENYLRLFRIYRIDLQNTFFLTSVAATLDILLRYPFAYFMVRKVKRLADVFRAILIIPLFGELYIAYGPSTSFFRVGLWQTCWKPWAYPLWRPFILYPRQYSL